MAQPWWKPVWSRPAALRAVRATVVVPALFAFAFKVIGNPQTALICTFGGFATLVIANFAGTRKDKLIAHAGLAVTGSIALIIGTMVSGTTWLAAVVTVPVVFAIFFAGVAGPNAVSGSTAALFGYVLPVASVGGASTIPARLEGWWLASVVGTAAVLLLSPPSPGNRLKAAAAEMAGELADRLRAAADGQAVPSEVLRAARDKLQAAFTAAPYRPTGLATPDQALNSLAQLLKWDSAQFGDAFDGHVDMTKICPADTELLRAAAALFGDVQALLSGREANPDFHRLEAARARSAARLSGLASDGETELDTRVAAAHAVHAQSIAVDARRIATDALIASRRADPQTAAALRRQWYGLGLAEPVAAVPARAATQAASPESAAAPPDGAHATVAAMPDPVPAPMTSSGVPLTPGTAPVNPGGADGTAAAAAGGVLGAVSIAVPVVPNGAGLLSSLASAPGVGGLAGATAVVARHATLRSVWFLNSLRGAIALAVAVAVADVSGLQHGFWVVLGTLSVLRTSAASTGATASRALAGTVVGFVIGALMLLAIGTEQTALWVALPLAVLVATYAPGTTPFAVGQAAFTVMIVVLFNLLDPVGWKVGLLRIEDVAIGCGVSVAVGLLFWPRGASTVLVEDLADSFRRGSEYLTQAVDWALSELMLPPAAALPTLGAGLRLDDAVRGFLAEQGAKKTSKDDLWTLVAGTTRLRLTANTLAGLRRADTAPGEPEGAACLPLPGSQEYAGAPACVALRSEAAALADFYGQIADEVTSGRRSGSPTLVPPPPVMAPVVPKPGTPDLDASVALHPHLLWVQDHLHHLSESAQMVSGPALRVAEVRRRPWWR
jgi:hypothetical protein